MKWLADMWTDCVFALYNCTKRVANCGSFRAHPYVKVSGTYHSHFIKVCLAQKASHAPVMLQIAYGGRGGGGERTKTNGSTKRADMLDEGSEYN